MIYTVCFLFTPDGKNTLLLRKNKTEYAGKLNGVGGKIEKDEPASECAIREIREETGAVIQLNDLHFIAQTTLPHDCGTGADDICHVYFYSAIVPNRNAVSQQDDSTERLTWIDTSVLLGCKVNSTELAGDGDIPYMVNMAVKHYGWDIEPLTETDGRTYEKHEPDLYKVVFNYDDEHNSTVNNIEYAFGFIKEDAQFAVIQKYKKDNKNVTITVTDTIQIEPRNGLILDDNSQDI